jgi:hypothetical protein
MKLGKTAPDFGAPEGKVSTCSPIDGTRGGAENLKP